MNVPPNVKLFFCISTRYFFLSFFFFKAQEAAEERLITYRCETNMGNQEAEGKACKT